jgi:rhodanese-related sulfurtransferase
MISAVLHNGGTVYDLMELEHAYAPQFSSAKDPVNIAGYVAANIISGHHKVVYYHQLQDTDYLIDVRNDDEYAHGSIDKAINIPLHELRSRMNEIPQSGRVVVFCMVGQRGYIAQQILHQHGFKNVYNISGGYKTWHSTN